MRTPAALSLCLLLVSAVACPAVEGDAECAGPADCGDAEAAPCERCPVIASAFCVEGVCAERPADAVDVEATFVLDRSIDDQAAGLAWAIAVADRSCADLGSFQAFPADLNASAAGQKSLSGGAFHPDLSLARVPAGSVLVLALVTDGAAAEGNVLGAGCVEATASAPGLDIEQLNVAP